MLARRGLRVERVGCGVHGRGQIGGGSGVVVAGVMLASQEPGAAGVVVGI